MIQNLDLWGKVPNGFLRLVDHIHGVGLAPFMNMIDPLSIEDEVRAFLIRDTLGGCW
jgi:hypothetical protein